jgi:quercetin dioxygenase-like cupin family protein
MRRVAAMLGSLTVWTVLAQQPLAQQPLQPQEIFSGAVSLQRPQASKVNIAIHLWTIRGWQQHAALEVPGRGTLVVQLRAGSLTTVIGGRRQERKEGEFWTVPAGVTMGVETGQDTATLQTVLIGE